MILWTIQHISAWNKLQSCGFLRADIQFSEKDFLPAYNWILKKMNKTKYSFEKNILPLWAWKQWQGKNRAKPDLRASGHMKRGTKAVRIEFEIDEKLILLSDYELWHYVLNYWYLPNSEKEIQYFENILENRDISLASKESLSTMKYRHIIEKSWDKIFDLNWEEKGISSRQSTKSIQASFIELQLKDVKSHFKFIAR